MRKKVGIRKVLVLAYCAASIVSLGFAGWALHLNLKQDDGILSWIKESNMHFYFVMLLLFFMVFLGMRILAVFFKPVYEPEVYFEMSLKRQGIVVLIPVIFILGFFLHWFCVEQFREFPFTAQNQPIFLIPGAIACCIFAGVIAAAFFMIVKKKDISRFSLYFIYLFCTVICFYSLYYVNIFKVDMHHGVAVMESIYNVCDLVPFSKITTGIYGHYSLFFMLPMRMAHGSPYMASALLAFSGCIMYAAYLYVIHSYLPKNWLRAVAACAGIIDIAVIRVNNYWQLTPIRIVFPMLMYAYICFLTKNREKSEGSRKYIQFGYFLSGLAVLWNTEYGLFCLIAFSLYVIMCKLQRHQWFEKCMIILYIKIILSCMGSMLFAVGIVNLYNLFCGGKLILRAFFFPLFTDSFMDQTLRYDMPWGNHAWIYVFLLFAAAMAWGLYHTRLFRKKEHAMCKEAPAAAAFALLGLLSFSYYANRAAYANLMICYCEALCINAMLIKETWISLNRWETKVSIGELGRKSASILAIVVVVCLGGQIPLSAVRMAGDSHSLDVRTTTGIADDLSVVTESLSEEVYGVGSGISMLYHMLGWNNYAHVRDFSDFYVGGDDVAEAVVEMVKQQKGFLVSGGNNRSLIARLFVEKPYYRLKETFSIQDHEFQYFEQSDAKVTDWMMQYMSVSKENEKTSGHLLYIDPRQFTYGPFFYLGEGRYSLHTACENELKVIVYYNYGADIIVERELSAGRNAVEFVLPKGVRNLEVRIDNPGEEETVLTELYVEKEDGEL